jgi:hypothetical protein
MEKSEKRKAVIKYILKDVALFTAVVIYAVVLNLIFGYSCPLKIIFDIDCPFCGMTRAHFAALRLDFTAAFRHHSLFFLGLPYLYVLTHEELFKGKAKKFYLPTIISLTALFIVRYIISFFI